MERLATVQAKFDENVLDATNAWSRHVVAEVELAGLPANTVQRARQAAEAAGQSGWLLSLDAPNYQAVMTHAESETLRREFYEAWVTRASDQGPHAGQWDNSPLMAEILALRSEAANLVGFSNFAEYSIATKMAHRTGEVLDFLRELARVSRPAAAARVRRSRAVRGPDPRGLGRRVLRRAPEACAARRFRRSAAPLFPVAPRARGTVHRRDASLRRAHRGATGRPRLPRGRPLLRHPGPRRHPARRILPRPLRPAEEAWRRLDGRVRRPDPHGGRERAAGRLPGLQLLAAGRQPAVAAHPPGSADAVPRIRARAAPHAHASGLPERRGHQRRAVGRRRTAEPVHGELRLARRGAAAHFGPRRDRRTAAGGNAAQAPGHAHVPGGHAHRAAARIRAVRLPAARGVRARLAAAHRRDAGRGPRRGGRRAAAGVQPLPEQLPARVLGRLCRRLLQLQVGRGAVGRCLRRVRGARRVRPRDGTALPQVRYSSVAAAAMRWRHSSSSAGASRRSSHCCGSWGWRPEPCSSPPGTSIRCASGLRS